jgi:hypothetical protein
LKCLSVCLSVCLCVCLSVRTTRLKVFFTAPNQTVFIADLPYLAHTFTMSPRGHQCFANIHGLFYVCLHTLLQCFQRFMQIILYGNRGHLCSTNISCFLLFLVGGCTFLAETFCSCTVYSFYTFCLRFCKKPTAFLSSNTCTTMKLHNNISLDMLT